MKNIVFIGLMGCGKTTIAYELSKKLSLEVIDLDHYIETKYQETIQDMFCQGEDLFRSRETECCHEVSKKEGCIISTGGGVIKNKENIDALKENGYIIYIDRPVENIVLDVTTASRPLLKNGPQALYDLYHERHHLYQDYCDYHFINDISLQEAIEKLMEHINRNL